MKRFILCFLFLSIMFTVSSQKVYFVYLQAEIAQPFFVKMNDKLYNSTVEGYLILSNLRDTTYNIGVGFSQEKLPEPFSLIIDKKDHGYLIKNFPGKGWGLYDLQNSAVQMSATPVSEATTTKEDQNTSAFANILSKAADDPSLKEKTVQLKPEEKKPDTIQQEEVKREEIKTAVIDQEVSSKEETKSEVNEKPVLQKEEVKTIIPDSFKRSAITKRAESSNVDGFGLVFIDDYENKAVDTIRILIPNPKSLLVDTAEKNREEKKFLDILPDTSTKSNNIISVITKDSVQETNNGSAKITCADTATENDFYLLRKNMASANNNDNMISEATNYFKTKCFSTVQLKDLCTLFLNDAGRYKFFDAAYPYVLDRENFGSLESELKDEYYIKRFKAMLR